LIFGPRSGSKTENIQIPLNLPPGVLQEIIPIKIKRIESFRKNSKLENLTFNQKNYTVNYRKENAYFTDNNVKIISHYNDKKKLPSILEYFKIYYITCWADENLILDFLSFIIKKTNIKIWNLEDNVIF
jgi:beta-galactosidase